MNRYRILFAVCAFAVTACGPTGPSVPVDPTIPTSQFTVWALGDSQGAPSNNPARGLSWAERLPGVANGAVGMEGSGWTVLGPYTGLTIPQQAEAITSINGPVSFIVMAGINDLGGRRTVDQMLAGVAALEAVTTDVVYVGIVPITEGSYVAYRDADRSAFNAALAATYPDRYIDCDATMSTATGWLNPNMAIAADDLHLNSTGEQALTDCITTAQGTP